MDERAASALIAAAMRGDRQVKGGLIDSLGGRCAIGVIEAAGALSGLKESVKACPFCGATKTWTTGVAQEMGSPKPEPEFLPLGERAPFIARFRIRSEAMLVVHLNNDHEWDFLTIARKLGPTGAEPA